MADNLPSNSTRASDEIDLGQLMQLIKKGFYQIGNFFLRIFLYLKRNALKLLGLIVFGLGAGFGLKLIVPSKLKTEVIVRPNFESKNYLYDVVDEIEANIKSKDEAFFGALEIPISNLKGFAVQVEAIEDVEVKSEEALLQEMKYLEVLQNFKDESFVIDILRTELSEKSIIDHKITFSYKDPLAGPEVTKKLIDYINTNTYFDQVKKVYRENAESRITKNMGLINQIDELVDNYSKSLLAESEKQSGGTVNIEADNSLNVPSLLIMKNTLLKEMETKKLELAQQTEIVSVLNIGRTQMVKKPFFNQKIVLIPSLLVLAFFIFSFFQYLNRKSSELH